MKCPVCQAKLLPVAGEMFCLQCGNVVPMVEGQDSSGPAMDETTDPLLQKAIVDAVQHEVNFHLPVSGTVPTPKTTAFNSMRQVLAPPPLAVAGVVSSSPAVPAPTAVAALPVAEGQVAVPSLEPKLDEAVVAAAPKGPTEPVAKIGAGKLDMLPAAIAEPKVRATAKIQWSQLPVAWMAGLVVFMAFIAVNAGIYGYYAERIYPGVKAGDVSLGGTPMTQVKDKLKALVISAPVLTVDVAGSKYELDPGVVGGLDIDRLEREVLAVGRTTPLPLAGMLRAMMSSPVAIHYAVNDTEVKKAAAVLVRANDHRSSDAVPMIVAGKAFVVAHKTGSKLDPTKVEQAIRGDLESKAALSLSADSVEPLVQASAYKSDLALAQAKMALTLKVKVKTAGYVPNSGQVGEWLSFRGPGKGVAIDGAKVSAYVAGIAGKFDRLGATNALIAGLETGQSVDYTASTSARKVTPVPQIAASGATLPLQTYRYCVAAGDTKDRTALTDRARTVLSGTGSWALTGRIAFQKVEIDCNFTLLLSKASDMAKVNSACADSMSCLWGNRLVINHDFWLAAPTEWTAGLAAFQGELISQEMGHWLGFDRPGCLTRSVAPILEAPTVILGGCSPSWYAVPAELQAKKTYSSF